ncbi:MAG: hypothetical protein A3J48_02220 [Candidatus Doudnabacteria bacterium RIFCSPHIGHO2_02_FULL_46_11]|uniref:Transglycosylase SLT domain-containing protein n=1 Tax=Candidatus Doudnabacteria bacterium RIFCSPHIGHO2_02_FULL_46_11 TaxID=1817832 RepID=A0A1F5P4Y2_9BACT|nr:MAG: hypothetical protein A3J48_02220 [Candidatus Doudnabacteria bacterium RIFCSPHIGHO2_02_FULL_46_11]
MTNPTFNFLPKKNPLKIISSLLKSDSRNKAAVLTLFIGVLLLGLIQTSVNFSYSKPVTRSAAQASELTNDVAALVFGENFDNRNEMERIIEDKIKFVATRKAFMPSLYVVAKHESEIRNVARSKNIPENVALGISFLENGGSETAISVAGAAGIYQLMPGTARGQGMRVDRYQDDRLDPNKSIEAGLSYLLGNYRTLGDWGLAIWSYHAGAGNVCKAVKIYAEAIHGETLGVCGTAIGQYVKQHAITVHTILSNKAVQARLTDKLKDDSAGYAYKVVATSRLFELNKTLGDREFAERLSELAANLQSVQKFLES